MEATRVLDYAPAPERSKAARRQAFRWLGLAVGLILLAVTGGLVGHELTPPVQYANEYYQVNLPPNRPVPPLEFAASFQGHVAALGTPEAFDEILADVRSRGIPAPAGEAGHALLRSNLRVEALPSSTVVKVSFTSTNRPLANGIVSAVVRRGIRDPIFGVAGTTIGTSSGMRRSPWGAVAGALAAVVVTVAVWRYARRALEGHAAPD